MVAQKDHNRKYLDNSAPAGFFDGYFTNMNIENMSLVTINPPAIAARAALRIVGKASAKMRRIYLYL